MFRKKFLNSYTLSEVVIVMLIIAVVVGVSIKVVKAKLDAVVSYTYYSAYSTLSEVSRSMYLDIVDKRVDKKYLSLNKIFNDKIIILKNFFDNNFITPVYAANAGDYAINAVYCGTEFILDPSRCNQANDPIYNPLKYEHVKLNSFASTCYDNFSTPSTSAIPNTFPGIISNCGIPHREIQHCEYGFAYVPKPGDPGSSITNCKNQCYYSAPTNGTCNRLGIVASVCPTGQNKCGWYTQSHLMSNRYTCPEPASIGLHVPDEKKDTEGYFNVNPRSLTGTCYYYAVECTHGKFLYNQRCYDCNNPPMGAPVPDMCNDPEPDHGGGGGSGGGGSDPDPDPVDPPEEPEVCDKLPGNAPCGMVLDEDSCEYVERAGFSRECSDGKTWSETECECINTIASLPQNGREFCELFETYVNISGTACNGDAIADNTTDFSGKKADITLRNGIKLYNLSPGNAAAISELESTFGIDPDNMTDEVRKKYYEQAGYLVYADIDGQSGDSILWEDVYPFYITLSGKVIPVFDKAANPDGSGGDSKNHLQLSVQKSVGGLRRIEWIVKSVSFREAACTSGYINQSARYCSANPTIRTNTDCETTNDTTPCKIRPIKPVYLFF